MFTWGVILIFIVFIIWSLWLRVCHLRHKAIDNVETKASPVSFALQDLVATAGGVYLSLVMLVSFLKLDLPEKLSIAQLAVDPLALLSIVVAIIQPLFLKLLHK